MLYRLYDPIIWRSLNVYNHIIRGNSLTLFVNIFPVQLPNATQVEKDEFIQKQFNTLINSLNDCDSRIRVIAVQGICRILNIYWELIPVPFIQNIFNILLNKLLYDGSNSNVRSSVIEVYINKYIIIVVVYRVFHS